MHNVERGIIKWAPFNSVVSGNEMLNSIVKEKNKIAMPTLSDEQKEVIEKKLILALYSQNIVNIYYFQNGKILNIKSNIKKIDSTYHKIYFQNKVILIEQIIEINQL